MAFRFLRFEVYKNIKDLVRQVLLTTLAFPSRLKFSLAEHINKAVISVLLNFAEGSDRGSDKEFARFIDISIGSLNEVIGGLDIARDEKVVSQQEFDTIYLKAEIIVKKLSSLKKQLKSSKP